MTPIDPASLPSMTKQQTPKTMSSRLMTMKFMQRGAAAAAAAAPEASSPATPKSEDGSSKRRKVSHTPSSSAPTPATLLYDQKAIHEALEEEEKKRLAAVEKRATELGDSHWVLPGVSAKPKSGARKPLNVVQIGFAQIDYSGTTADDNPFEESSAPPQTQFRRFNMKKSKPEKKDDEDDSEDSSASDSDDNSDSDDSSEETKLAGSASRGQARGRRDTNDNPANKRTRSNVSFSNKREEERKKAQQLAGKRRQKEIKLSQLSSISSVGSQDFQQQPASGITCYRCGKVGHKAADCSKKR